MLAHYDAILVLPALGWFFIPRFMQDSKKVPLLTWLRQLGRNLFSDGLVFILGLLAIAMPFYVPYSLDPQANRTGNYLGGRIGQELRNNLPDFFHFNTFYSSFYYLTITSLLVLGLLTWFIWRASEKEQWFLKALGIFLTAAVLLVVIQPKILVTPALDLSALPFGLLLLGAFFALSRQNETPTNHQALIAWLAIPFLGYNFVVALGLTHIYTIIPAWSLLAALAWVNLQAFAFNLQSSITHLQLPLTTIFLAAFILLSSLFLWNAFVRHDVEYRQDYPQGKFGPVLEPLPSTACRWVLWLSPSYRLENDWV